LLIEHFLVLQHQRNGEVDLETPRANKRKEPKRVALPGPQARNRDIGIDPAIPAYFATKVFVSVQLSISWFIVFYFYPSIKSHYLRCDECGGGA
jgi:hypothetical protein